MSGKTREGCRMTSRCSGMMLFVSVLFVVLVVLVGLAMYRVVDVYSGVVDKSREFLVYHNDTVAREYVDSVLENTRMLCWDVIILLIIILISATIDFVKIYKQHKAM